MGSRGLVALSLVAGLLWSEGRLLIVVFKRPGVIHTIISALRVVLHLQGSNCLMGEGAVGS
jgi:hypothetical protein